MNNSERIRKMMPPEIEARAARNFEEICITRLGIHLSWNKLPIEVKNCWRIQTLVEERDQWRKGG